MRYNLVKNMVLLCVMHSFTAYGAFEQEPSAFIAEKLEKRLAGDWSSGGGNAVVCFHAHLAKEAIEEIQQSADKTIPNRMIEQNYIDSIEMYDLFEAKLPRGFNDRGGFIVEIEANESYSTYANRLARRFLNVVPAVHTNLMAGKRLLPDPQFRYHSGALQQHNDIGDIALIDKSKCIIQTIAAQRSWNGFFDVYLDARLFNHPSHTRQSKATLIIHEYMYAFSRRHLNHEDSSATRKMVEVLISSDLDITIDYVAKLVFELGYGKQNEHAGILREHIYDTHLLFSPMLSYYNLIISLASAVEVYTNDNVEALRREINEILKMYDYPEYPAGTPLHDIALSFQHYDHSRDMVLFQEGQRKIDELVEVMAEELRMTMIAPRLRAVAENVNESRYISQFTIENVMEDLQEVFNDLKREIIDYTRQDVILSSGIIRLSNTSFNQLFIGYKKVLFHRHALQLYDDLDRTILPY